MVAKQITPLEMIGVLVQNASKLKTPNRCANGLGTSQGRVQKAIEELMLVSDHRHWDRPVQIRRYNDFVLKIWSLGYPGVFWLCLASFRTNVIKRCSDECMSEFYRRLELELDVFRMKELESAWTCFQDLFRISNPEADFYLETLMNNHWITRDADILINLLHSFGKWGMRLSMLRRLTDGQSVWGPDGRMRRVSPEEMGMQDAIICLASNYKKTTDALNYLLRNSLITYSGGASESVFITERGLRSRLTRMPGSAWDLQASLLLCCTFPLHARLDPMFGNLGRELIDQVASVMEIFKRLDDTVKVSIAPMFIAVLLAASKFSRRTWKLLALESADTVLWCMKAAMTPSDFYFLLGWSHQRWNTLSSSEKATNLPLLVPFDERGYAISEELEVLRANQLMQRNELEGALTMLKPYTQDDLTHLSDMEMHARGQHHFMRAKIYRVQGNFAEADQILRSLVFSQLRGLFDLDLELCRVWCELGKRSQAEAWLRSNVDLAEALQWGCLGRVKRLHLTLAETLLEKGDVKEAKTKFEELQCVSVRSTSHDVEQLNSLRIMLGMARIAHLEQDYVVAMDRWTECLKKVTDMGWKEGFIQMVIYYSIADLTRQIGDRDEPQHYKAQADKIFADTGRQHWFLGLGTTWLTQLLAAAGSSEELAVLDST